MDSAEVLFFAVEAGLFVLGAVLGALSFRTIALPLLYTFPLAAAWGLQGRLRWRVVPSILVAPVVWAALFVLGFYFLARYQPEAWEAVHMSAFFYVGVWLGISVRAFRALGSNAGQLKLRDDFLERVRGHLKVKPSSQNQGGAEDMNDRIWHLSRGGTRYGPFTYAELLRQAKRGELRDDDLLWRPGVAGYVEASTVLGSEPRRP